MGPLLARQTLVWRQRPFSDLTCTKLDFACNSGAPYWNWKNYDFEIYTLEIMPVEDLSPAYDHDKLGRIVTALEENNNKALKRYALSKGGLLNDELRRKVWPKIIGRDIFATSPHPCTKDVEEHPYYQQVVLDVNRSLKRFPPSIQEQQRLAMQDQLVALIMRVLIKHPQLHYYQGYHDICVTFLLVLGEEIAFNVVERISTCHLNLFMEETMDNTSGMLEHIYPLVGKVSPNLRAFMEKSEVGVIFCLSWVITWYGHVLSNYEDVVRLFDLFLASDPWLPLYVSAALLLYKESDIMKQECDMACVHSYLSSLPIKEDLPIEDLVTHGLSLLKEYPPSELKKEVGQTISNKPGKRRGLVRKRFTFPSWTIPFTVTALVVAIAVIYQVYKDRR